MENSPQLDAAARSNLEKAAKAIDEVRFMKQDFFSVTISLRADLTG
jgi:hypothetical protein